MKSKGYLKKKEQNKDRTHTKGSVNCTIRTTTITENIVKCFRMLVKTASQKDKSNIIVRLCGVSEGLF